MSNRQLPINYLKQYIGIKEGSDQHKAILNVFNDSNLCERYSMTTKDAWCATAVSAAFIATGLSDIFPCVECSCANMVEKAKKAGVWVELDSYEPEIGDVIMYDWQDSGKGDDTGHPDHVGIVVKVASNQMTVIEGNKNDSVGYRTIKVDGKFIRGFIAPKYPADVEPAKETTSTPASTTTSSTTSSTPSKTVKWTGVVTASALNVRKWAGKENAKCSFGPLKNGTKVEVCDTVKASDGDNWYYIQCEGKYGFVSAEYIKKA